MANNPQATQQQPALAGIALLFHTKAQQANAVLNTIGKSLGNPGGFVTNQNTGRRKQVFDDGEITETKNNTTCLADLAVLYTPFSEFIARNGHHWLGNPIEDFYSAKNGAGNSIVVQRYQRGTIWWDGKGDNPYVLSWHDWKAIAGIDNQQKPAPGFKVPSWGLPWFNRIALQVGQVVIVLLLCGLVFLLLYRLSRV